MSICGLFLVDEDLFLNFLSSSYSLVTKSGTKLLKRGGQGRVVGGQGRVRVRYRLLKLFFGAPL